MLQPIKVWNSEGAQVQQTGNKLAICDDDASSTELLPFVAALSSLALEDRTDTAGVAKLGELAHINQNMRKAGRARHTL